MRRALSYLLSFILPLCLLCTPALAEKKASISLGGKLGLIYAGDSGTIKPKLKGITADALDWSSSDTDVAIVSGGTVVAKSVGVTIIKVSGGGASSKCGIVVLPKRVEIEVGMRYRLPNCALEKYGSQDRSIAKVNKSGEISGIAVGETLVGVQYGKQTLAIEVSVKDGWAAPEQSAAAGLPCASTATQIVLVEHQKGSTAKLSIHEKQAGVWKELYSCAAYVGSKGIGKTKEGDHKTPSGCYNITQPFGIKGDPGANMPYTKVTKYHYWCGTSGSSYYNQLVDERVSGRSATSSDEKLINYGKFYNYCMFIDYNADGEAGKGSCIFLHCDGGKKSTAGCISVSEKLMKAIIQWAKPGAKIVIR